MAERLQPEGDDALLDRVEVADEDADRGERAAFREGVGTVFDAAAGIEGDLMGVGADMDGAAAILRRALPAHLPAEQRLQHARGALRIADGKVDMLDTWLGHRTSPIDGGRGSPGLAESYNFKLS